MSENSNTERVPYLFTSKEWDSETGLYYYGARYLDPRTSVWLSPDPAFVKYIPTAEVNRANIEGMIPGGGGVYKSFNLNNYSYSHQNPIKYVDPNGKWVRGIHKKMTEQVLKSLGENKELIDAAVKQQEIVHQSGKNIIFLSG